MGVVGGLLIAALLGGGGYTFYRVSHPRTNTNSGEQKTWRERMPWGNKQEGEEDEENDVEGGEKSNGEGTEPPKKGWSMPNWVSEIEIPSANQIKLMVAKKGLSQGL
mmetsp:Transcript_6776/g.12555  ORF Transcript_6776/g.12555 Transcript_6776/m.12555 type:complete len:107 (+) Transcript_6776:148-468(+)|eukprot:CAMPEP_0178881874 /NCGR_PEP_ID=MMETSP0747-20121128/13224_1 /TAXON_ID=913974 /ORGANISM="Nitzschia punctata, Strain CCMP561" /LENGTH=106 /DNA_ID=CAMNT_0020549853 /DNA_START=116 /DNA_END=436 /DNA_ORIENTATION=-